MSRPASIAQLKPCRDCGAEILVLRNLTTGRWMPVEDEISPEGNIRVDVYRKTCEVLAGARLNEARAQGEALSLAHHVNCPAAAEYRHKPRNGTQPLFDPDDLA